MMMILPIDVAHASTAAVDALVDAIDVVTAAFLAFDVYNFAESVANDVAAFVVAICVCVCVCVYCFSCYLVLMYVCARVRVCLRMCDV